MLTTDFKTALTHLREGRPAEAFTILSRIVDRWPTYAAAQVAYAQALHQLGQPEASFQAWSRAEALVSHSGVVEAGLHAAASAIFAFDPSEVITPEDRGDVEPAEEHPDPEDDMPHETAAAGGADVDAREEVASFTESEDAGTEHIDTEHLDAEHLDTEDAGPEDLLAEPLGSEPSEAEAEWFDGPLPDEQADTPDPAEWDGGYAGDSGDGVDPDVELTDAAQEADLDRLIDELQTARIVPAEDPASIPPPDLSDDIDDVVSETLAGIYATQSQFAEAARVYERLALENPDRADEYRSKASEMRARDR